MNTFLGVLFNALGFAAGAWVYVHESKRRGLNLSRTSEVAMLGALIGVVAASAFQWGFALSFHHGGDVIANGGRTILGGVLGGWIGVEFAKRRLGIRESTGPLWALALPAGEAVGRLGCWFHGCCYGKPSSLPWAVFQHGEWRHPTQFYLSFGALLTFLAVWRWRDRVDAFALFLTMWCSVRIIVEPLRESSGGTPLLVPTLCGVVALFAIRRLVVAKPMEIAAS